MKNIVLLSDTHNDIDNRIYPHLKTADEIWHAGDIGTLNIINTLESFSSVKAVYGNIDGGKIRQEFNEIASFKCEDVNIIMTHIGGYPGRYAKNIKQLLEIKKPDLFISGHSHILKIMYDKELNILHMNPGAIGNYGIHQVKTILTFNINGKNIENLNVIEYNR